MNENELLTNVKRREENMNRIEVLDKTSEILSLKTNKLHDVSYISKLYKVNDKEVKSIINKDNLNKREVLSLSMELFDSKVAQEVRSRLLDIAHDSE